MTSGSSRLPSVSRAMAALAAASMSASSGRARRMVSVTARPSTVEGLDLALELEQQRLALAVDGLARRHLHPAFADAVLLDIGALLAVEANAHVVFEHGGHVVGAARVGAQVVGQG